MTDTQSTENLTIQVHAAGQAEVIQALNEIGTAGEAATARVISGYVRLNSTAADVRNNAALIAAAIKSGVPNLDAYKDALDRMTSAELSAAAAALKLDTAERQADVTISKATASVRASSGAHGEHAAQVEKTKQSYSALSGAIQAAIAYVSFSALSHASDEFLTIQSKLALVTGTADNLGHSLAKIVDVTQAAASGSSGAFKNIIDLTQMGDEATGAFSNHIISVKENSEGAATSVGKLSTKFGEVAIAAGGFLNVTKDTPAVTMKATAAFDDSSRAIKAHTEAIDKANVVEGKLLANANATGQDLERTASLYSRLGLSAKQLGIGQEQVLSVTELLNKEFYINRMSTSEVRIATDELTRAFSQGNINSREFQMLLGRAPGLVKVLADALTNGSVPALKEMALQHEITTKAIVDGLLTQKQVIDEQANLTMPSITNAWNKLNNNFVDYIGHMNETSQANQRIASGISLIADNLNVVIPIVASFAALWASVKIYSVLAEAFTILGPWGVALGVVVVGVVALLDHFGMLGPVLEKLKGVWDDFTEKFVSGLGVWNAALDTFVQRFASGWERIKGWVDSIKNAITTLGSTSGGGPDGAGGSTPPSLDLGNNRSGGRYTIPGGGPVDSVPVHFMASPGEVITVQTPAQAAGQVPHFRDGGSLIVPHGVNNNAQTLGLAGVNVSFGAASGNSVLGYQASTASAAAANGTASNALSADSGGGSASDFATAIANALTVFSTSPTLFDRAVNALSYIRGTNPQDRAYIDPAVISDLAAGISVKQIYSGITADDIRNGPLWSQADGQAQTDYDKAQANYLTELNDMHPFQDSGVIKGMQDLALAQLVAKGAIPWNSAKQQFEAPLFNNFQRMVGMRNTGSGVFTARDGLDYLVPGGGPVDSRMMQLAVSPGEHVSVKTPAQQQADRNGGNGGQQVVVQMTVNTPDANSFKLSETQTLQRLSTKLKRIAR